MNKTIIVSNRLPVDLKYDEDQLVVKSSSGGLATGMKSVHKEGNGIWIGWSGLANEDMSDLQKAEVDAALAKEKVCTSPAE